MALLGSDPYAALLASPLGKRLVDSLGLPKPTDLRRYAVDAPLLDGPALIGGLGDDTPIADRARTLLAAEGVEVGDPFDTLPAAAIIVDLTAMAGPADLERLRAVVAPSLKRLTASGRVVVVGRPWGSARTVEQAAAHRALVGATKSIAKELRAGATANLVVVAERAEDNVEATLRFLLSGRSAYVSGQVIEIGPTPSGAPVPLPAEWTQPLAGKVAVVTGAARGIGAAIAGVLARDGATIVAVDMPAAGQALAGVANRLRGTAVQADVTASDTGARIVEHCQLRHGGLDIVVHNAGITRDKLLANTDEARWGSVLDVNLLSIIRMNEALLAADGVRHGGHLVLVSSIAGIAGNRGQTSYGASKAGVIGLTHALAASADVTRRGITANAVAPGFIETEMTGSIPFATREIGRRLNSLQQGGLPLDVAETVAWLSQDANAGVTGQVVRVCGQSLIGA
jgi:3-oxoacyl-[acyl-carrier protein] reductase